MAVALPGPDSRWRCRQCGNLTRFDLTRVTRSQEYWHVDLAGEPVVEEREVTSDVIEHVTCRWCAGVDTVDAELRPGAEVAPGPAGG
jgi:hypothetical protein